MYLPTAQYIYLMYIHLYEGIIGHSEVNTYLYILSIFCLSLSLLRSVTSVYIIIQCRNIFIYIASYSMRKKINSPKMVSTRAYFICANVDQTVILNKIIRNTRERVKNWRLYFVGVETRFERACVRLERKTCDMFESATAIGY